MRIWWWLWLVGWPMLVSGQKKWDGEAGNSDWMSARNWYPDGVPSTSDSVLLDNQFISGNYNVQLPAGNTLVELLKIRIAAGTGKEIILEIPNTSTASPALIITDMGDGLIIDKGGVFIHASIASSGNPLQLNGKLRLQNEGRYIHRTARSNSDIAGRLSSVPGTENGIFELDMPGTGTGSVSLTGKTFGSLIFSATTAGTKSYQATGSTNVFIRGNLVIRSGAKFTNALSSDIFLMGDLLLNGTLSFNPTTTGTTNRSFHFSGPYSTWSGNGILDLATDFRQLILDSLATLYLNYPVSLPNDSNMLIIRGMVYLKASYPVKGQGYFQLAAGGGITVSNQEGICRSCSTSSIQTKNQFYSKRGRYYFLGPSTQLSGIDLPDTIGLLSIQNPKGLTLQRSLYILDSLVLKEGQLNVNTNSFLMTDGKKIKSFSPNSYVVGELGLHVNDMQPHVIPIGDPQLIAPIFVRNYASGNDTEIKITYISTTNQSSFNYWMIKITDPDKKIYVGTIPQKRDSVNLFGTMENWITSTDIWTMTPSLPILLEDKPALEMVNTISNTNKIAVVQQRNQLLPIEGILLSGLVQDDWVKLRLDIRGDGHKVFIEQSENGSRFYTIDSMEINSSHTYSWQDRSKIVQPQFYRVASYEGGMSQFSNIIKLMPRQSSIRLYPNPAQEKIFIFLPNSCSTIEYRIVNSSGATIRKLRSNSKTLDISALASGSYFLQLINNDQLVTLPFTKN